MDEMSERDQRLADWNEMLSGMTVIGSLTAWSRQLHQEVKDLQSEGLIDAGEAREMKELADAALGHRS
jgi:hypothetical protein